MVSPFPFTTSSDNPHPYAGQAEIKDGGELGQVCLDRTIEKWRWEAFGAESPAVLLAHISAIKQVFKEREVSYLNPRLRMQPFLRRANYCIALLGERGIQPSAR